MEFKDPLELFEIWMAEATLDEPNDPNAMYVATVDETGLPNIRVVLLKDFDQSGFVFYTNTESAKGQELLHSSNAAFCFDWKSLQKRVVLRGQVDLVSEAEADTYFQSRPRQSRLGAWASRQSRPLASKAHLLAEVAKYGFRFGLGTIPRPPHWTGFRLQPIQISFHDASEARAQVRLLYEQTDSSNWSCQRLS